MAKPTPVTDLQEAVDALTQFEGNFTQAADSLGVKRTTFQSRIADAKIRGITAGKLVENMENIAHVRQRLKRVEREMAVLQEKSLDEEAIRSKIIALTGEVERCAPPEWTLNADKHHAGSPGVPTLLLSDLHWGEVVRPTQINGVNEYNLKIANARLRTVLESAIKLLKIISPEMNYPGIVVPLGGDMISGNIHDELQATNELNTMPTVLDLFGALVWLISNLADEFGRVFLPCVTGNHGRDTHKIWNKDRHATSFDWLLYCFLAKRFEADKRVTFMIPDGPDAYYRIFHHRYLLTHGDQFRGGDGMIGALGPIIRGDHKKRSRNAQIDMEYDTLVMGHWHQEIFLRRLIVNGSLKGYDEYAYNNNFGFEPPCQQLWITHPSRISYRMPVYPAEGRNKAEKTDWVSVK